MGDWGNDRPLTLERENWVSMQSRIPLLTITDDPRRGKRIDEITEFQPGEPDPTLFQFSRGYTVREGAALDGARLAGGAECSERVAGHEP
ncbi:MAG TPA: hypothetical protein VI320_30090 [Terracidiphilus sp.]